MLLFSKNFTVMKTLAEFMFCSWTKRFRVGYLYHSQTFYRAGEMVQEYPEKCVWPTRVGSLSKFSATGARFKRKGAWREGEEREGTGMVSEPMDKVYGSEGAASWSPENTYLMPRSSSGKITLKSPRIEFKEKKEEYFHRSSHMRPQVQLSWTCCPMPFLLSWSLAHRNS